MEIPLLCIQIQKWNKKSAMKKLILDRKKTILGIAAGAIAGWMYWYFIGCSNGSCGISSTWYMSTLYFSIGGGLLAESFSPAKKAEPKN